MSVIIHFLNGNDESIQQHYYVKAYRNDIIVQVNQTFYEVYFHEEGVMKYEMADGVFFSMPGLIVLDAITHDNIVRSIKYLYETGYFNWFAGFDKILYEKPFMSAWYLSKMSPFDKNKLESLVILADT